MSIWFNEFPLGYANDKAKNCLIGRLGIELFEAGEDCLRARMPVDNRTRNPAGVLHGGASVALAETLGTWAAAFCVDPSKHHCVGLEINANHLRPDAEGGFQFRNDPDNRRQGCAEFLSGRGHRLLIGHNQDDIHRAQQVHLPITPVS